MPFSEKDLPTMQTTKVFQQIQTLLAERSLPYRHVHHQPTYTSEESARARGESVRIGGKALLIKIGDAVHLFVLSAALKFDSAAVKRRFGVKRMRFATVEELRELTGLIPGSVPPFGRPTLPFDLFVDESILAHDRIAFNAGSLTDSIIMSVADYIHLAQPEVFRFAVQS